MIGMWVKFKKFNSDDSSHFYEFWTDLNDRGKFLIKKIDHKFSLLECNDEFTERQKKELEYYSVQKLAENNFPEKYMIAHG